MRREKKKTPPNTALHRQQDPAERGAWGGRGVQVPSLQVPQGRGICTRGYWGSCALPHKDHRVGRQASPLAPLGQLGLGGRGQLQTA